MVKLTKSVLDIDNMEGLREHLIRTVGAYQQTHKDLNMPEIIVAMFQASGTIQNQAAAKHAQKVKEAQDKNK